MRIESLNLFCDVVETRSFSHAALLNGVSHSGASQTISSLENQFQMLLLERHKGSVLPTPEGRVIYEYCRRIVREHFELQKTLHRTRAVASVIRLATTPDLGLHDLPPFQTTFLRAYPSVELETRYLPDRQVYEAVLGGATDLGLVACPRKDPRLKAIPLRPDPLVLVYQANHPMAKRRTVRLQAIKGRKFIHFTPDVPARGIVDRFLRGQRVIVEPAGEFHHLELIKRAVELGDAVALVPQAAVGKDPGLRVIGVAGGRCVQRRALIYREDLALSPAMKQFAAWLKRWL